MLDQLAVQLASRTFASLGKDGRLSPRTKLPQAEPVFPRYVEPAPKPEQA
jgi:hypothetical protein